MDASTSHSNGNGSTPTMEKDIMPSTLVKHDESDIDPVWITALVIGTCVLIVGVVVMMHMSRSSNGGDGMKIYFLFGKEQIIDNLKNTNVTGYRGERISYLCYNTVSDVKKCVWPTVSRGVPQIDMYDIEPSAFVDLFETYMTLRDIDHHPLHDENWMSCMAVADEFEGYMDVFPAFFHGADTVTSIDLTSSHTRSVYGCSVIDNSFGDVDYAAVMNLPTLYKIDNAHPRFNVHIYVRASV